MKNLVKKLIAPLAMAGAITLGSLVFGGCQNPVAQPTPSTTTTTSSPTSTPKNNPPTITDYVLPSNGNEGTSISGYVTATDPDGDNLSATISPSWLSLSSPTISNGTTKWTISGTLPQVNGTSNVDYDAKVTASDSIDSIVEDLTLTDVVPLDKRIDYYVTLDPANASHTNPLFIRSKSPMTNNDATEVDNPDGSVTISPTYTDGGGFYFPIGTFGTIDSISIGTKSSGAFSAFLWFDLDKNGSYFYIWNGSNSIDEDTDYDPSDSSVTLATGHKNTSKSNYIMNITKDMITTKLGGFSMSSDTPVELYVSADIAGNSISTTFDQITINGK